MTEAELAELERQFSNHKVMGCAAVSIPTDDALRLLSLDRRASKLEGALRIAEQYVRSRHNEGNPSCCTCDSKSPRGVCKDLVQIREALAPEDR